jgi:hypothetical protein
VTLSAHSTGGARRSRALAVLACIVLLALAGCRPEPERLPLVVTLAFPWAGDSDPLVIRHAERELAFTRVRHQSGPAVRFELPEAILHDEHTGYFSVHAEATLRYLTPCGWREIALRDWGFVKQEDIERHRDGETRLGTAASLPYAFQAGPRVTLVIDRRGVEARELRVGEVRLPLPPEDFVRYTVFAPDCPEGGRLSVDDREIAKLPTVVKLRDKLSCPPDCSLYDYYPDVLLDLAASHCYTYRTVKYGHWPGATDKPPRVLRPSPMHRLHGLQSAQLFTRAPESVTVRGPIGTPAISLINELLAVKCK